MNEENNFQNTGINTMPKEPTPEPSTGGSEPKKEGVVGPVIGALLIIVILVLGALYYWGYIQENRQSEQNQAETKQDDNVSPEVKSIEDDLNSVNVDETENELNQIDAEIDASLE